MCVFVGRHVAPLRNKLLENVWHCLRRSRDSEKKSCVAKFLGDHHAHHRCHDHGACWQPRTCIASPNRQISGLHCLLVKFQFECKINPRSYWCLVGFPQVWKVPSAKNFTPTAAKLRLICKKMAFESQETTGKITVLAGNSTIGNSRWEFCIRYSKPTAIYLHNFRECL